MQTSRPFIIYIDSKNRLSGGTSSNFDFQIELPKNNNYDTVALLGASIPKSWYAVQNGYNQFTFQEDNVTPPVRLSIPVGWYSRGLFATTVGALLNAQALINSNLRADGLIPNNFTVVASAATAGGDDNKLTFIVTKDILARVDQPRIIFTDTDFTAVQFGFALGSINIFENNTLESSSVQNMQSLNCLIVKSDLVRYGVLEFIPCSAESNWSIVQYICQEIDYRGRELVANIGSTSKFNFQIIGNNEKLVDLNGLDVQLRLIFFKREDYFDIARSHIILKNLDRLET